MNVLVLCTGNSCRSQIAEGFLKKYLNDSFSVYSAGIEKHGLNPKAVEIMAEIGIDISNHTSDKIEDLPVSEFDYVITVCDNAKENCPIYPAKTKFFHQTFTDPSSMGGSAEEREAAFRVCRQALNLYCQDIAGKLNA